MIVDCADVQNRYDGLQYLKLTLPGAYCLGMSVQYIATEPAHGKLIWVLPNLDIVGIDKGLGNHLTSPRPRPIR